jgi:peptidoglycan/LPS O-acetylase OafA/YrhL
MLCRLDSVFWRPKAGKILPSLMTASVAAMLVFYHSAWFLPKFFFNPMVLEFCAGCVLYHARNFLGIPTFCLMCVGALISLYFVSQTQFFGQHYQCIVNLTPAWQRCVIWGGFAVCLVGIVTQMDLKRPGHWPKVLSLFGDASYSIYLLSPLIMWTVGGVAIRLNKLMGNEYVVLSPLLSGVIYIGLPFGSNPPLEIFRGPGHPHHPEIFIAVRFKSHHAEGDSVRCRDPIRL